MMAAKAYARRTSSELEFADYLQYAHVGLLESIERYDPDRGAKFETYAAIRINGAILYGLESSSELHEQLAARRRMLADRASSLNGDATDASGSDVFARLADIAMGLAVGFMLEDSGMFRADDEGVADSGYAGIELRQMSGRLHEAVDRLPERQQQLIRGHYLQHQTFDEIAQRMNVSRGRVSQLHRDALGKLAGYLRESREIDFSC
jgi:RNA polymerase sigma factor for flagellar operon FliA